MASIHQTKHGWLQVVSPIVFTLTGLGITELPVTAMPKINNLAQVGVRSRVVSPTPLNLQPKFHIPLPQSNYHRRSRRDRDYHHRYGKRRSRSRRAIIIINPAVKDCEQIKPNQ